MNYTYFEKTTIYKEGQSRFTVICVEITIINNNNTRMNLFSVLTTANLLFPTLYFFLWLIFHSLYVVIKKIVCPF